MLHLWSLGQLKPGVARPHVRHPWTRYHSNLRDNNGNVRHPLVVGHLNPAAARPYAHHPWWAWRHSNSRDSIGDRQRVSSLGFGPPKTCNSEPRCTPSLSALVFQLARQQCQCAPSLGCGPPIARSSASQSTTTLEASASSAYVPVQLLCKARFNPLGCGMHYFLRCYADSTGRRPLCGLCEAQHT